MTNLIDKKCDELIKAADFPGVIKSRPKWLRNIAKYVLIGELKSKIEEQTEKTWYTGVPRWLGWRFRNENVD